MASDRERELIEALPTHEAAVERLKWASSRERAAVLIEVAWMLSVGELRLVLTDEWSGFDAIRHHRDDLLELLRRTAPVSDTGRRLSGELLIYRGNLGEDPRLGLSWTLSRAQARWFALYPLSERGRFLGLERADGGRPAPTVWRATVEAEAVLGYFGRRREQEVIPDPDRLRDVVVAFQPRVAACGRGERPRGWEPSDP